MDALMPIWVFVQKYASQHMGLLMLMLAGYFIWPGMITKVFKWVEDKINAVKFTVGGYTVDFSKFQWDDEINHYLRDYVITLSDKASGIKNAVVSGEIHPDEAEAKLQALTHEVVENFKSNAPMHLREYADAKFGGDKVAAAEFVVRRVKAIVFDMKKSVDQELRTLTNVEVAFLTKLAGQIVDKTLKDGEDGDKVFKLVVLAINKILKTAQANGLDGKFEIMTYATRAWLVWYEYEKEHDQALLTDLMGCAKAIMKCLGDSSEAI